MSIGHFFMNMTFQLLCQPDDPTPASNQGKFCTRRKDTRMDEVIVQYTVDNDAGGK
jgi:hypothetical protein